MNNFAQENFLIFAITGYGDLSHVKFIYIIKCHCIYITITIIDRVYVYKENQKYIINSFILKQTGKNTYTDKVKLSAKIAIASHCVQGRSVC